MTIHELPLAIDLYYAGLVRNGPPSGVLPSADAQRRRRIVRRLITLYAMQGIDPHLTVAEALARACRGERRR